MSCGRLLSGYLPLETQVSLLSELVKERRYEEVVGLLDATQLGAQSLREIDSQILETVQENLRSLSVQERENVRTDDGMVRGLSQLISRMSSLQESFELWISGVMFAYMSGNKGKLFEKEALEDPLFEIITDRDYQDGAEKSALELTVLLEFLDSVFLYSKSGMAFRDPRLDAILISLLGCNDEAISSRSSNLMRWRIGAIAERCATDKMFDHCCWSLVRQVLKKNQRIGLSFLLRFLTNSSITPGLEEFVRTNEYWAIVQSALNDDVQECRKIGLSIIKLSIKGISQRTFSIDTPLFSWKSAEKSKVLHSWKRFTTLYEIVSLDTALNQIEAASRDILNLFEDPYLHPTWALVLFSTGLRASMESVRKYMVALLLRIKVKSAFANDLANLRNIFLPSIMEAHFFTTDGKSCCYGDRLTQYISDVLEDSGEDAAIVIETMLNTLVDQGGSFDPARIYMSLGILEFMEKENQNLLTSNHLTLVAKLYEFDNEDAVFETTIQTIYLRYLLHVSPTVSVLEWIQCVASHIKRNQNNYEFIAPMLGLFEDFTSSNYNLEVAQKELQPLLGKDATFDFLSLVLFECKEVPITHELLIESARSKEDVPELREDAKKSLISLLKAENVNPNFYDSSDVLADYPGLEICSLSTSALLPLFNSTLKQFSGEKLKLFVALYKSLTSNCSDSLKLEWPQLRELYQIIKSDTSDPMLINFKVKDEIYGAYFDLLYNTLSSGATEITTNTNELIDLLDDNINKDNGNFEGNKGVSKLCALILSNYTAEDESQKSWTEVLRIFDILAAIWDSFSCERLVLRQKSLHLETINGLFHPKILLFASSESQDGVDLSSRVHRYGSLIVEQAYSRRSMLPLMSDNICTFVERYGSRLQNSSLDYWWLVDVMTSVFTCDQTNVNMFKLKTVIADLFERKLSTNKNQVGLYERAYGVDEISAKIKIISSVLQAPLYFKDCFVARSFDSTNLLSAHKKTDGSEEIQRLLKWQLVLLCVKDLNKKQLIHKITKEILENLLEEVSPIIRIYMEWTTALLLTDDIDGLTTGDIISRLFSLMDDHSRPIVVVSAERIIFLILKELASTKSQQFENLLSRFTSVLIPNATSSKPLVRHFSNSLMLLFWPSFEKFIRDPTFKITMKGLYDKAIATKMSGKYRAGDANVWNINADLTLTGIFGGVLKKTIDHDLPYIPEDTFIKFLPKDIKASVGQDNTSEWLSKRDTKRSEVDAQDSLSNSLSQLQTKSGAWESLMTLDNDNQDKAVKRSDLIVVSSLVNKPPNLGGICRLCDVLGVGLLTVQDIRVKNHPQFKNVAVTADRWMPMVEVPVLEISNFMREKKREGYVLIGLEQTDKSVKLDTDYKFPQKSLILLGTEAHGIPGELLNQLDLCLEIQQFGVIRSMNIQTATAVIVHSYTIQHM